MHFSIKQRAIIGLCIVALTFALLNVAVRFANEGFGSFTQVYLRIALGFILASLFFFKEVRLNAFKKISGKDWIILVLMGTLGYGIAVDFITLGVIHTNLFNASVISSTTPFFILLFNIIFLRKKVNALLLFFLLVAFYGVCVLATNSLLPKLLNFSVGDLYVLLFAIGSCFFVLGRKFLSSHLNNSEIAIIVMAIAFLSSFIVALFSGQSLSLSGFINPLALFGILLGGVLNLAATKLQNFGFHHLDAVVGSQLLLLQNVFAPIFGFTLFHEVILPIEIFGAFLVIAGVWLYIKFGED